MKLACGLVVLILAAACAAPAFAAAPTTARTLELRQLLRKLRTTARLMQTTAHPDDEDGGMLTLESRGKGASVLLLTLDRGEGGQNRMGSNLLDSLGVLRTLELLASDRFYDVEQRFTRVADFGYSKNPEETFAKWHGHDAALADMVRVVRDFRPDVLVSRFQGTARDGHGQHSAAGILTREAFRTAADPSRFPEQLKEGLMPWQAKKLYVDNARPPEDYTLALDTDAVDSLLGKSYIQYAREGLKHQLSQGAGSWNLPPGPHRSYYKLVDSVLPAAPGAHEQDFFDGIDTSLPGLATRLGSEEALVPFLRPVLMELDSLVMQAMYAAERNPTAAGASLLDGLYTVEQLIGRVEGSRLPAATKSSLLADLRAKQDQFAQATNLALGVELEAVVDAPPAATPDDVFVAVPGQSFRLTAAVRNHGGRTLTVNDVALDLPSGWHVVKQSFHGALLLKPGERANAEFVVEVPSDAELTRPYWHRDDPERDAIYTLDEPQYATLPFVPPPITAHARYSVAGGQSVLKAPLEVAYRNGDELKRMPLAVGPPVSVKLAPAANVLPLRAAHAGEVMVEVEKNVAAGLRAEVLLELPLGWHSEPATATLEMKPGERRATTKFHLTPGKLQPGRQVIRAVVKYGRNSYAEGYTIVTRPDLGAALYHRPAEQRISVVDVRVPSGLEIGYVMGAGDDIPTVLQQLGMDVTLLSDADLASGDLRNYDTIVLGIRVYDTREGARKYNSRLLDYVARGGTLVVQYNSGLADFNAGHYTPYPAELGRERVSVEEAPVEVLAPQDMLFRYPNEITPADFQGWVQERGLYFLSTWDPHSEPLLASHDPGEAPLRGGLLRARYGKGVYFYSGYSFFRQLPAGVPGAIRLFVNLVSTGLGR